MELLIIGGIALLLFGKRLPEVARGFGKSIVEFKKGVRGIEDEIDGATHTTSRDQYGTPRETSRPVPNEEAQQVTAPKFEPPTSAPT
jgi:sec-independent protein translocase protein TatA